MVLDTASVHLESRSQSSGAILQEPTATMAAGASNGLNNGYTNSAYTASDDEGVHKETPIDVGVEAMYGALPTGNHVAPTVDPRVVFNNGARQDVTYQGTTDSCGYCCWTPRCLQMLATGRSFVFFCSLLSLAEAGLTIGYISSVVTSIEQNFNFSSTLAGFIVSCYDIGTLVVVLTSYYGGRTASNRPKWIAWSAWTMSLGACIVPMSHFFAGNYVVDTRGNATDSLVCLAGGDTPGSSPEDEDGEGECTGSQEPVTAALGFLVPGMLLIGVGSTSMFTLGTTYIDDYVRRSEAPILLAVFFCATVIGPGLGFVVGFLVLELYVDFNTVSQDNLTSSDPDWLGAWWLGFFICAAAIAITAIPVYAFPARLPKPSLDDAVMVPVGDGRKSVKSGSEDSMQVQMAFDQVSLKIIPRAIWNLMKNPVYMMINIASAVEFSIVTGFVRFSPKFIEYQFNLSASTANLITGILVPVGAVGVVIGGIILNRVKRDLMTTIHMLCIFTIISGCLYALVFIPGACPTLPLAGATTPYIYKDSNWNRPSNPRHANLTSPCNAHCNCQEWDYIPICGTNAVTYFSACHAGCTDQHELPPISQTRAGLVNYTNCSCIENFIPSNVDNSSTNENLRELLNSRRSHGVEVLHDEVKFTYAGQTSDSGISGQCLQECNTIIPFICLLLLLVCVTSIVQMPALMTTLRSVKIEERPFALGLQFVIIRLLGYIPAPIYYGATIDGACVLWQRTCSDSRGACLEYDNVKYFYRYLGLSTGLKVISVAMAIFCWIVLKWKYARELSQEADLGQSWDRETNQSNASLSKRLDDGMKVTSQSTSNGISVISSFNMADTSEQTREPVVMDTVFS